MKSSITGVIKSRLLSVVAIAVFGFICTWNETVHAATNLTWVTARSEAIALAKSSGKRILLVEGRDACPRTRSFKNTICEDSSIKPRLSDFLLWYSDCDTQDEETTYYSSGLGTYTLPLVCVVDPADEYTYISRTTGITEVDEFDAFLNALPAWGEADSGASDGNDGSNEGDDGNGGSNEGDNEDAGDKTDDDVTPDGPPSVFVVVPEFLSASGSATGGKTAPTGTKVVLRASAKRGFVFSGWYQDEYLENPCDSSVTDYRSPSYTYVMGETDKTLYARFDMSFADTNLNLTVDGVAVSPDDEPVKSFTVGTATNIQLAVESRSLPKIAVRGLPAGLKWTAKPIYKRGSKTEIETPANSIYGAPTKPGVYTVKVSLTNTSIRKAVVSEFEIVVPNLVDAKIPVPDQHGPFVPGVSYTVAFPEASRCKVTGLPAGMKWTAKDIVNHKTQSVTPANSVYGAPTKPGKYTVYFTKTVDKVKHTATSTFIVGPFPIVNVEMIGTGTGKVTGAGAFAANKKVTLRATADTRDDAKRGTKKSVFAGWYLDEAGTIPVESSVDYRTASLPYVMTAEAETTLYAMFVTQEEDSEIALFINGNEITDAASDNNFVASGRTILPFDLESISIPKATVRGLPAGMKFTTKVLTVKATKTEPAYDVPANSIYGTPTKPGLYKITVSLTNTSVKKALVREFTIEVPNFTAADHLFRNDGEFNIANGVGEKYSMYVGVKEFDLPKIRLNSSGTLKVTGLPAGLKYVPGTSSIEGIATKAGNYTVYLTVGKLVSTFTIEVKPLPDWVVGTFEGWAFDVMTEGYDGDGVDGMRVNVTISGRGSVTVKQFNALDDGIGVSRVVMQVVRFLDGVFIIERSGVFRDNAGELVDVEESWEISKVQYDNAEFGVIEGWYTGEGYWGAWDGDVFISQNIWKKDTDFDFLPEISNGTEMFIDMTGWKQWDGDDDGVSPDWFDLYVEGCTLNLKFGRNGAVTAAFYEDGATRATGTASATLMPYDRDGDTVKALLTVPIAPRGRHSICVALYLDIDVSRGIVYGDDIKVTRYLMEAN